MTDDRPRPKYGEYAPVPPASVEPAAVESAAVEPAQPTAAPPRTGDIVLTTALLLIGVLDVVRGFPVFASLSQVLQQVYAAQAMPAFTSVALADAFGLGLNIARVVLLLAVIAGSLLLIRRRRRAFWVPLAGAAISALLIAACMIAVILIDPAFAQYMATQDASIPVPAG